MRRFLGWCAAGLAAAMLLAAAPARADVSFGYEARYVGLGGAGLAIIDNPTQAALLNPAALSLRPMGFGIQWPNVGVRVSGAGVGKAFDEITTNSLNPTKALDLARSLGGEPTRLDGTLSFGLAASVLDLRGASQASILITPGAAFQNWARADQDLGTWAGNQIDLVNAFAGVRSVSDLNTAIDTVGLNAQVHGAASVAPSIGVGMRVPRHIFGSDTGDLRVGVRVKPTRTYYSRWIVRPDVSNVSEDLSDGLQNLNQLGIEAVRAPEMGNDDTLEETSVAADVGLLWQPAQIPYTTFAVTVNNLLEPSFTMPGGAPNGGEKLMPRTFNAGVAVQIPAGVLLVADVMDITGANGEAQVRAGAELRPNLPLLRSLAVRAGYNSATGFAAGLGVGGFGISYASRSPIIASQTFNF